jgi:hypothetical protein
MKEITECIGDIGRANSTIFMTLDLTSGFGKCNWTRTPRLQHAADYLSRLPGAKETIASISAFDPFQADLYKLQMQDEILQGIQTFRNTNQWLQTKARPSILHGHDRQAVPRQE